MGTSGAPDAHHSEALGAKRMLSDVVDEYALESIADDNEIRAGIFLPFTIVRLQGDASTALEVMLSVHLKNIGEISEQRRSLWLRWSEESIPERPLPVQEDVITEWAACGVACALVPLYAKMRIIQVAQQGDRFDYWVGNGEEEYALEVSGTVSGDLAERHAAKLRQLQSNPYEVDGFVVVVRFVSRESIFSFNRFEQRA
jgi:hypothetical protein